MYIDGDIWLADGGEMLRVVNGNSAGWEAEAPGDAVLRDRAGVPARSAPAPSAATGTIYGFDAANDRLIALSKVNGAFLAQYRLAGGATAGRTSAASTSSRASRASPTRSSGSARTRLHRALLEP